MTQDEQLGERDYLHTAAQRLQREFVGVFGAETIERLLSNSLAQLSERASLMTFVPLLAERFTRERLRAASRSEGNQMNHKPSVLFLCVHNAGRSQMAAGWLQHLAGDQVDVYSGGSAPAERVNPAAVEAMAEAGIDIADAYPKPWTDEILAVADVVVTMGCGDACPVIPGKRYLDWELEDPAGKTVDQVRPIRDEIGARVRRLVTELGFDDGG